MFDRHDHSAWAAALREGLERLPVPEVSADFDAGVLGAMRQPVSWRGHLSVWAETYRARPFRWTLIVLTIAMMSLLLMHPSTRWLVWTQIRLQFISPQSLLTPMSLQNKAAQRYPNDFGVQLAGALTAPNEDGSLKPGDELVALRRVAQRFPDKPSVYAAMLRVMARTEVSGCQRAEEHLLDSDKLPGNLKFRQYSPEVLGAYDRIAEAGERLDPDNAFFPLMRAIGLFAARQDREALAAVRRAGRCARWQDYLIDEAIGRYRLAEAAYGHCSAFARVAEEAAMLMPHYAALRSAARVAVYKAIEAERAGDYRRGIEIRRAVRHAASLMRQAPGSLVITALVGNAIGALARTRPGGAPPQKFVASAEAAAMSEPGKADRMEQEREQWEQRQREAYYRYLSLQGYAEEQRLAQMEDEASRRVREICRQASSGDLFYEPLRPLLTWWMATLFTLAGAIWVAALGLLAARAARKRWIRAGMPLSSPARWGAALAPLVFLGGLFLTLLHGNDLVLPILIGGLLLAGLIVIFKHWGVHIGLVALGALAYAGLSYSLASAWTGILCLLFYVGLVLIAPFRRGVCWSSFPAVMRAFWLTLGVMVCMLALAGWQLRGIVGWAMLISPLAEWGELLFALLSGGLALAVPLVTALVLAILSRIRRVPVSVGVVRGFRSAAVPLACCMLLAYGGLVLGTLGAEARTQAALDEKSRHEGRYLAKRLGVEWPENPSR